MTHRKDGRWQHIMVVNENGIKKRKCFYGKTKAELLRKISQYEVAAEHGATFEDLADAWYESRRGLVRDKTYEGYVAPLTRAKEAFTDRYIRDISAPEISAYIRRVADMGFSKRNVCLHLSVISMVMDYAIAQTGDININPCLAVTIPKGLKASSRPLPPASDIEIIKKHYADDRFSLLPFFLVYSGMRVGEAIAITDKDIRDGYIYVTKKVSWPHNQPVIEQWTKTEKGIRAVVLLDVLAKALPEFSGYLFSDDGKTPYSKTEIRRRWAAYQRRTGLTCDRHSLRHEFATLMYDAAVDTKEAAAMFGDNEETMRKIYTHIRESRKEKTASKLNEYVNAMTQI